MFLLFCRKILSPRTRTRNSYIRVARMSESAVHAKVAWPHTIRPELKRLVRSAPRSTNDIALHGARHICQVSYACGTSQTPCEAARSDVEHSAGRLARRHAFARQPCRVTALPVEQVSKTVGDLRLTFPRRLHCAHVLCTSVS